MSVMQPVGVPAEQGEDQLCIDSICTLSINAVQQVKSGHPIWPNRDRLALSGHVIGMKTLGAAARPKERQRKEPALKGAASPRRPKDSSAGNESSRPTSVEGPAGCRRNVQLT